MKTTDAILWNRLRKGDKIAFNEIFDKYVVVLFNYGKRFTASEEIVEDCVQELFTDLWLKRHSLGSTNQIKPYLLISIRRRVLRQTSKEKKHITLDHANDFILEYSLNGRTTDSSVNMDVDHLNEAIGKLTTKQKEVVYLKFFEQLSYLEIAQILKVDVKAVYKLMARAISNLRSNINT